MTMDCEQLRQAILLADARWMETLPEESIISHSFTPRFERRMSSLLRQQGRSSFAQAAIIAVKRVAVITLMFLAVGFTTVMSVEATRERVVHIAIQLLERYTSISVSWGGATTASTLVQVFPEYLPLGMELYEQKNTEQYAVHRYKDINGNILWLRQKLHSASNTLLDTEGVQVYSKTVAGQQVWYYTNKGYNQMYWHDNINLYSITTSLDHKTMMSIAESIIAPIK